MWKSTPPWSYNTSRIPCIAAGFNIPAGNPVVVTSSGSGPIGWNPNGNNPGDPRDPGGVIPGYIDCVACIDPMDSDLIILTTTIQPASDEAGKTFRFANDQIRVDDSYCPKTEAYSEDYPFEVENDAVVYRSKFSVGSIVPEWTSKNKFLVSVDLNYSENYQSSIGLVYAFQFLLEKGPELSVNGITLLSNNRVQISFSPPESGNCSCFSTCLPDSGISIICNGKETTSIHDIEPSTYSIFSFNLTDSNSHTNEITVPVVANMDPLIPVIGVQTLKPERRAVIGIPFLNSIFEDIQSYVKGFQVERYLNEPSARKIISDWTNDNIQNLVYDTSLKSGNTYGYRLRYLGKYGDFSKWSNWTTVQIDTDNTNNQIDNCVYG